VHDFPTLLNWGLRNYAGGSDLVWGGDNQCEHDWSKERIVKRGHPGNKSTLVGTQTADLSKPANNQGSFCSLCGAWRGQLGLEPTPSLYCEHLMMIFREVKRVLRKDSSFFLNIGDTYGVSGSPGGDFKDGKGDNYLRPYAQAKLTPKCMTCIPERVMFAMLDDGWILRNKLIWGKPNSMPSSVKDRYSNTYEMLYFFTKARKYYFDLDAIRIPHISTHPSENKERKIPFTHKGNLGHSIPWQPFNLRVRDAKRGKGGVSAQGGELKASEKEIEEYEYPEKHHGSSMNNREELHRERQKHESADLGAQSPAKKRHSGYFGEDGQPLVDFAKGKNPGDYWEIPTQPSSICVCPKCEAVFPRYTKVCPICKIEGVVGHFAPYPVALCEMPIKASTRVGDVVLDPLAGGGNTGVAAKKLGRKCILIDCVKEYCIMSRYKLARVDYQPELTAGSVERDD